MIEWLMGLSPRFRYLVYAAGAVVLFFVAVGVGAAAAVVTSWQFGRIAIGSAEITALERSGPQSTGTDAAPEDSAIGPPNGSDMSDDEPYEASFVHRATGENSRGDYTYIDDPSINNDPNAIVLATPTPEQRGIGSASYKHNVGVWYEPTAHKWAIFNQDRAAVPSGATFDVGVPRASAALIHHANRSNGDGNYTYLDNKLTNGEPYATLSVTQNWNPGGGRGVYNNHPVGTIYDPKLEEWAIYNRDGAPMPSGAAFNIAVSTDADEP